MGKTRRFATLTFFLASAAYITGSLPSGPVSGRFISMGCIACLLWLYCPLKVKDIAIRLAVFVAAVFIVSAGDVLLSLSALVLVCFSASCLEKELPIRRELLTYALSAGFMFTGFFFTQYTDPGVRAFNILAEYLSAMGGGLIGRVIHIGPTYAGCGLLLVFLCHAAVLLVFRHRERRYWLRAGIAMLLGAALGLLYISVWSLLSETQFYSAISTLDPLVSAFDYRLLLFALLLLPAVLAAWPEKDLSKGTGKTAKAHGPAKPGEPAKPGRAPLYAAGACAALLLAASALHGIYAGFPAEKKQGAVVALYSSEVSPVALTKPVKDSYGLENTGMFGMLPEYLQADGYKFITIDHIDSESLKGCDVLMVVNLMAKLPKESEEAVWAFVRQGHSLLLLGDHTGGEQIRIPSNELLAPVNISFNFDAAIPLRDLWNQSFDTPWHPVYRGLRGSEYQINIGASLSVAYPARSVVMGRNGYSDIGDAANTQNGYLGDMQFTRGERLGDLTLMAEAPLGAGKIWVSGDTSFVQTLNLPTSYGYVSRLFRWLASSARPQSVWMDFFIVALLLAAALLSPLCMKSKRAMAVLAGAAVASAMVVYFLPGAVPQDPYAGNKIAVDRAINNSLQTNRDPNSIDGLMANIERNGYDPYLVRGDGDLFGGGYKAIVEIAPSTPMSPGKVDSLMNYMDGGGVVVLAAGWRETGSCDELLQRFGLSIGNTPLGRGETDRAGKQAKLWEAWPIEINAAAKNSVQVLAEEWDYPVAVYCPKGRGGLVLICDAQFFSNKNLEDKNAFTKENIDFFGSIVSRFITRN